MAQNKLTEITKQFLEARNLAELADQAKAKAESLLKEAFAKSGVEFSVVDGQKVALVKSERSAYDTELFQQLVSAPLFKLVTVSVIDRKKLKSAIELGKVTAEVAEAITEFTSVEALRVTQLKSEQVIASATSKVA